jgi:hypothetical protein
MTIICVLNYFIAILKSMQYFILLSLFYLKLKSFKELTKMSFIIDSLTLNFGFSDFLLHSLSFSSALEELTFVPLKACYWVSDA